MITLEQYVPPLVIEHLSDSETDYLVDVFDLFGGYPSLEQMWSLMDEPWKTLGCDPLCLDERVQTYYRHPVWMLNGLFIEQHEQSLKNRRVFTDWIVRQGPVRIADFGGGFGGLARLVGEYLPDTQVEVVEPHPHPAATALAESTPNVRFVSRLYGEYDLLIATDVFEHVYDPIGLAAETAAFLRVGGQYLMANCFQSVIQCHLPQLFHLHIAWDAVMQVMGLEIGDKVGYGRSFRRFSSSFDVDAARKKGECAKRLYSLVRHLPRGQAKIGALLMSVFCW